MRVSSNGTVSSIAAVAGGFVSPELITNGVTDLFTIHASNPGEWANDMSVSVYPNTAKADGTFYVDVFTGTSNRPVEHHLVHLNYVQDGFGVQRNVQEYVNRNSSLIRITQNFDFPAFITAPNAVYVNTVSAATKLAGGTNGTRATSSDFINAFNLYEDPEVVDVNMLINAGHTDIAIQQRMEQICRLRMDCIAILDMPVDRQKAQDAVTYRRDTLMIDSSYAAVYSPDVLVKDEYSDINLFVPLSGYVAAAYARTDRDYQLWFAPAGMKRGSLDVLGVREVYDQGKRDMLVDHQINPVRVVLGAGIKLWGADTTQTFTSADSNVSVRRLMMFLEKSLAEAALYSVFEPSDPILWSNLWDICDRFLKPIKDAQGLYWYQVVCDERNNIPATIAAGDVNLDVYVDPSLPGKRIHLNAIVNKTGARMTVNYVNA
jgi:phage tail sheath protein FI